MVRVMRDEGEGGVRVMVMMRVRVGVMAMMRVRVG